MKTLSHPLSDDVRDWIPLVEALTTTQLSRAQLANEALRGMVRTGCTLDGCTARLRPVFDPDNEGQLSGFYVLFREAAFHVINDGQVEVHEVLTLTNEWFELQGDADPPRNLDEALRHSLAPRRFPTITDEHLLFSRADLEWFKPKEQRSGAGDIQKTFTLRLFQSGDAAHFNLLSSWTKQQLGYLVQGLVRVDQTGHYAYDDMPVVFTWEVFPSYKSPPLMATLMAELDEHRDPIEKTGAVRKFRDYLPPELVALVEGATKELQPSPKSAPPELSPAKVGRGESPPKKPQLSDKEAKRLLSNPENYSRAQLLAAGGTEAQFKRFASHLKEEGKRQQPPSGPRPKVPG